jgi:hypothetical protein
MNAQVLCPPASQTLDPLVADMKNWVLENLYPLNKAILLGEVAPEVMIDRANAELLCKLPAVETLGPRHAWPIFTLITALGTCVERHIQQAFRKRYPEEKITLGEGLRLLYVNQNIPFLTYVYELAAAINHPRRDSFTTFIEFNGPCVEVNYPGTQTPVYRMGGLFPDGAFITFTGGVLEEGFIRLLKLSTALQGATNLLLEKIHLGQVALDSLEAVQLATGAASYTYAMRDLMEGFLQDQRFTPDFFMDEFRQYAIRWSTTPGEMPSSASQDPASLLRDIVLFSDLMPPTPHFGGFRDHVQHMFPMMRPQAVESIKEALSRDSLEAQLESFLGEDFEILRSGDAEARIALIQKRPWLAAYIELYRSQFENSRAHYSSILKYLAAPKQKRDRVKDPRENVTVVPNSHGSSGMDPRGILRQLHDARSDNPLVCLSGWSKIHEQCQEILDRLAPNTLNNAPGNLVGFLPSEDNSDYIAEIWSARSLPIG